jgi:hypothetical protein
MNKVKLKTIKILKIFKCHYIWRPILKKLREGNIYLEKYNSIYFPIPKVACSSLKKFFSEQLQIEEIKNKKIANIKIKQPEQEEVHRINFPCVPKEDIIKGKYTTHFKFTFVRNPWDRILSCYLNKIDKYLSDVLLNENGIIRSINKYHKIDNNFNFEKFVKTIEKIPDSEADPHFRSQYLYITDKNGKLLVDFIGKFENLNEDFKFVGRKIGLDNKNLPEIMKTSHKNYREYYTEEIKNIIARRYKKDVELFNYKF